MNKFEGTVETCAHRVTFRYWDFRSKLTAELEEDLTREAEDRAHKCISEDGCVSGELNHCHILGPQIEEEIRGWWEIKKD